VNTATGTLYYIPLSGQSMSSADVEFPVVQSLVDVAGTYASPAHNITFTGITFTGTSWLGPAVIRVTPISRPAPTCRAPGPGQATR
jgi:hypothetical protein